jgi:DNA mismatch repair protein MutL
MPIRVLPELLINQIAAGEVVEDPLSIVKELIENALDAGAQTIAIELIAGGHRLIRVTDDGSGMDRDDAILCFERHATSKIGSLKDLEVLSTMGFRGEALAAIAGVSKVTLKTATQKGIGTLVEIEGGRLLKVEPCARSYGTTIEVRDLFFNVPARRRFQKSPQVSGSKIEKWLSLFSLGYPEVTFSFREQEKELCLLKQEVGLLGRIREVYGSEFANRLFLVEEKIDGLSLKGFFSPVDLHRLQRSGQVIFINRRLVQAPLLNQAVRDAYSTSLPEGRYPLFTLHLQLAADQVDVNVHPQKKEVRFSDEERMKHFLRESIHKNLTSRSDGKALPQTQYAQFQPYNPLPWALEETPYVRSDQIPLSLPIDQPKTVTLLWHYLLIETSPPLPFEEKFILVDLQRALERIMEDRYGKELVKKEIQSLLVSIHVELSKKEAEEVRKRKSELEEMGVSITELGERLFCIEQIPAGWDSGAVATALVDFLAEEKKEGFCTTSFHRCIKKFFLLQEAEEILRTLLKSKDPYVSPLGQATMVPFRESDLVQLFKTCH